jgi:hypothetical protein
VSSQFVNSLSKLGRTIPSFRIALGMEKEDWKPFRNALDKKDRKEFDDMFDLPKFYISACSNSVQYVRLHPIMMSILLYHYKQLTKCISDVDRIESRINNKYGRRLTMMMTTTIKEKGVEAKKREEKLKAVNPSGHNGNGNNSSINDVVVVVAAAVVPRQEENSKRKTTTRKKKLRTAVKQDLDLDTYFNNNNKIVES